ncbi:hypothetical protein BH20GEM3_BH20GEM3_14160 [soil metagenome]|jgi:hypothetical protein|nr:AP2 domain-containing protein [Gemmatimonadota bacterium]MDQ3521282.1 AP2 domain-containing protein [Gemmatimonadota bacterium]
MAKSGHKGISRIDQPRKRTHGWYVRVTFRGEQRAKFLGDATHGGKRKALREAVRVRNRLERELGKPRTDRTVVTRSPRSGTGVIGVQRAQRRDRGPGGKPVIRDVYVVTWHPTPHTTRRTTVSVDRYGEEEAFRRACELRVAKEREVYGAPLQTGSPPTGS